ncbi:P-loop containing nucleoside triphosphate hydrolase protein [Rickenella mellea]|uniref:P-loop containing nucleoside triphosphate hydrolase protein n=1 Tax=Rickenella mellea TaxID=50990 RepID=A0A4Y7QJP3_9AGAM|nr:P-loop containing nucleoside triphosphate hydrolase protein [Rickenella mellea]
MRRPTDLAVHVDAANGEDYHLTQSPSLKHKSSLDSTRSSIQTHPTAVHKSSNDLPASQPTTQPTQQQQQSVEPSLRLLFSQVSRRDRCLLLGPAILTSVIAGGIAPFMTTVIGQAFGAFGEFPLTPNPPQSARDKLMHAVGLAAIELLGLAVGAMALSTITSALWIATGERNVMRLRQKVYDAVTRRDLEWFDTKMGAEESVVAVEGDGPVGAGGLMTKFARETDDVRMASSLAAGMVFQYLTTCITCLILAFLRSWSLTLVILSAVPLLVIIQAFSQRAAGPILATERAQTATAATLVERALSAIATVKAFNASPAELESLSSILDKGATSTKKVNAVWGVTSALSQFSSMAMFVQGFWFGSKLVREGRISPGDVMAVFWACLIATSNLQMCIPQFVILARGKFAMVSLVTLINPPIPTPSNTTTTSHSPSASHLTLASPLTPTAFAAKSRSKLQPQQLRKIRPLRCNGEFSLHNVSFAYPSRPTDRVLESVYLFLPANETTFIVGGSGSGKSTIAQLLARLYTPNSGAVQLDDQDVEYLDEEWVRRNVALVSQSCIMFEGSVHDNVAMGVAGSGEGARRPEEVSREEVVEACTAALMHEFVRDLPEGYDTKLGTGGASLSGGQKQRLAIARAKLRDPTVLVLDEATSALDATSRILVFEAIKTWRRNKTTIVITHDLSQISPQDFVYVLKSGRVVEQGYRADLEFQPQKNGEFARMSRTQGEAGGFPEKRDLDLSAEGKAEVEGLLEEVEEEKEEEELEERTKHQSMSAGPLFRPVTLGNWMFDVVADLTRANAAPSPAPASRRETRRISGFVFPLPPSQDAFATAPSRMLRRASVQTPSPTNAITTIPRAAHIVKKRLSLQFTPTSPTFSMYSHSRDSTVTIEDDEDFEGEKMALERSGSEATKKRMGRKDRSRRKVVQWDEVKLDAVKVEVDASKDEKKSTSTSTTNGEKTSFIQLMRAVYPTIPNKPAVLLGLLIAVASGVMTPVFSFLLSRLLFEVSTGAHNIRIINQFGFIVLAAAALDGVLLGLKFFIMESAAMAWVTSIRKKCYAIILAQDKKWFDKSENAPVLMTQVLVKDGDDARNLLAVVVTQFAVVTAMLGVGLIWALVAGWQLTLAGFAIGPVFAVTMAVQANLVARVELNNKRAREEVAKGYYEHISNVRAIRAMSFESVFQEQYDKSVAKAHKTGVQGAFVEGCTYGISSALIYLAEALLFYVGAVLVAKGTYTYLQMVEVLQLVVFSVSIGSQLMAFTQRIAKSTQATRDFNKVLNLSTETDESRGTLRPPITGDVQFHDVSFSYPERPEAPVVQHASLRIANGECVAIVGASGSGKSTVAALLQRLYEPSSGTITIGNSLLGATDVKHLRHNVAVVSQNPNLFDATIAENISYGSKSMSIEDIHRAARAAHVHDFIMSLPKGYDTMVGENASLISGGQAQRLSIARALARPSRILILDECTSALDPANQAAVVETIRSAKVGRTTLMVTHKLQIMQMCDRILVMHDGAIAEQGTYEDLMRRNGIFYQLASGGEWTGE